MTIERYSSPPKAWLVINRRSGFSLVEVLLSAALFALLATGIIGAYLYGQEASALAGGRSRAVFLAEEGLEAAQNIRDASWAQMNDGTYGIDASSGQWSFSGASDTTDGFTRQITIASIDAYRKQVTSTVSWIQNAQRTGSVSLTTRLTYWQRIVAAIGDWTNPNTLPATLDLSGANDGQKIQVQGNYAYLVRADGTPDFAIIDVTTSTSPVLLGSLSLTGVPQDIAVSGNYAYVTSDDNNAELKIIDITTSTSPVQVATYNAPGNADAFGIVRSGTTVYVVRASSANDELLVINVTNPLNPTLLGSFNMNGAGRAVAVSGSVVYAVGSHATQELQIVSVANPATPVLLGTVDLPGAVQIVAVSGVTVFLGQGNIFYVFSAAVPASPVQLGVYAAGGTINDISLGNNDTYAFLATANTTNEFQVINVATPASPALLGGFNATGTLTGIAYDGNTDRAYVAGAANTQELGIIIP